MPSYEHTFIARQDITPQQVDALVETAKSILTEQGASVVKNEYWGLRNLSYRIKKNRKGHYAFLGVDGPAAAIQELERRLKINEDVLRFMTIKVDAVDLENPSAVLSKREERRRRDFDGPGGGRDDRPPRDDRPRDDRPPRGDRGDRDRS